MQEFLQGRINLVKALLDSSLPFHDADLVLIICTVLSACASRRWPGVIGLDKKKFIELLVRHSPDDFHASWVSVPSLLNDGIIDEIETPYGKPGNGDGIYCDNEIDLCLEDAIKKYPQAQPVKLQEHCYAYLIYERLRCGYSHEYWHHESITHVQASRMKARVSYIARMTSPNTTRKMISFHLDYLIGLAEYHVSILPNTCSERPSCWWIDTYTKPSK